MWHNNIWCFLLKKENGNNSICLVRWNPYVAKLPGTLHGIRTFKYQIISYPRCFSVTTKIFFLAANEKNVSSPPFIYLFFKFSRTILIWKSLYFWKIAALTISDVAYTCILLAQQVPVTGYPKRKCHVFQICDEIEDDTSTCLVEGLLSNSSSRADTSEVFSSPVCLLILHGVIHSVLAPLQACTDNDDDSLDNSKQIVPQR